MAFYLAGLGLSGAIRGLQNAALKLERNENSAYP